MVTRGCSERRALTVVHMSAAALRYVPRADPDPGLRDRIVALAHRYRRYGAGMIYLKLRQDDTRRVCAAIDSDDEDGESNRRILNEAATQQGWTSSIESRSHHAGKARER